MAMNSNTCRIKSDGFTQIMKYEERCIIPHVTILKNLSSFYNTHGLASGTKIYEVCQRCRRLQARSWLTRPMQERQGSEQCLQGNGRLLATELQSDVKSWTIKYKF